MGKSINYGALSKDRPEQERHEIIEAYYDTYRAIFHMAIECLLHALRL